MRRLATLLLATAAVSPHLSAAQSNTPPNILILVADDLGVDMLAAYGVGSGVPITPNIDSLAASGVVFTNAWADPICSPTRACMQTGRYGFRTGIGDLVTETSLALPFEEVTIPEMLDATNSGYVHAAIGKWHLGNASVGDALAPNLAGYSHFAGTLKNACPSYYSWPKVVDGVQTTSTTYATTDTVDEALLWIQAQSSPWFCIVNFNAPHEPFHVPPAGTYSEDLTGLEPYENPREHFKAAVESLDFELGRLFASLGTKLSQTMIFFYGDNGSPATTVAPPFRSNHAKSTTYEGGVNVPLIVKGPLVRPGLRTTSLMIHSVDFLATVAEIAGVDPRAALPPGTVLDSRSFLPWITFPPKGAFPKTETSNYTEWFTPNGGPPTDFKRAIRNIRYKLHSLPSRQEFYDLFLDPFERTNLLQGTLTPAQQLNFDRLSADLNNLLGS